MSAYYVIGLLCAAALVFGACEDKTPVEDATSGELRLSIGGSVLGESFGLEPKTYEAQEVAEGYRFTRVSMFLSDLRLVEVAGTESLETELAEVAYFELGDADDQELTFSDVPAGKYTALVFNLGLTPEQDAQEPSDFASSNPLSKSSEYWRDWGSYIFLKIEGKSDTLADGVERFDAPFVYHVGEAAENTREITVPIELDANAGTDVVNIRLDAARLLGLGTPTPLSLKGVADHRNKAAERIMENAATAFQAVR